MLHCLRFRARPALVVAALLLTPVAAVAAESEETEKAVEKGKAPVSARSNELHGALDMEEQQRRLAKILPKKAAPPLGVDPVVWDTLVPKDNRPTAARIELGRKLYFDMRLSRDGTVACATCHDVSRGFTDRRAVSEGIGDQLGQRNAPTTLNAVFFDDLFLDGRADTLEAQAKLPILNPIEMGQPSPEATMAGIVKDPEYRRLFRNAYRREPNYEDLARAIAAFERTLVFLDSPFDRFLAGEENAISSDAKAGWALFNGKARCMTCHAMNASNPIGTDNRFHNVGVSARKQNFEDLVGGALKALEKEDGVDVIDRMALETEFSELGRFLVSRQQVDIGAFKTLQVRNVGVTAPYMHDGSMRTLWDVMDHYNKGGEANPFLDGGIEALALTEDEIDQMVEWMFSLTDSRLAEQNHAEMEEQRRIATAKRPFRDDQMAKRNVLPFEDEIRKREVRSERGRENVGAEAEQIIREERGEKSRGQNIEPEE